MATCAICTAEPRYQYQITERVHQLYCASHLPSALKKSLLVTTYVAPKATKKKAAVVEEPVVEEEVTPTEE